MAPDDAPHTPLFSLACEIVGPYLGSSRSQPCADAQERSPQAPNWLVEEFGPADPDGTWGGLSLADMIHDFGPSEDADQDPEYIIDNSPAAMLREHGTWSV